VSLEAIKWALDDAEEVERRDLPVLFALADRANEYGACFPGREELARRARCDDSTVGKALNRMEKSGVLLRVPFKAIDSNQDQRPGYILGCVDLAQVDQAYLVKAFAERKQPGRPVLNKPEHWSGKSRSRKGEGGQTATLPESKGEGGQAATLEGGQMATLEGGRTATPRTHIENPHKNPQETTPLPPMRGATPAAWEIRLSAGNQADDPWSTPAGEVKSSDEGQEAGDMLTDAFMSPSVPSEQVREIVSRYRALHSDNYLKCEQQVRAVLKGKDRQDVSEDTLQRLTLVEVHADYRRKRKTVPDYLFPAVLRQGVGAW
jgi:hypothetical protein